MSIWNWRDESVAGVVACFGGKESAVESDSFDPSQGQKISPLKRLLPSGKAAWVEQIHSAEIVTAAQGAGCHGKADALTTRCRDLPVAVVPADCVPVVLASVVSGEAVEVGAVHAGWRGVAAEIVLATISALSCRPAVAWIGPAIGLDAYEVGHEVAEAVAAVSGPEVVSQPAQGRPHVDLQTAVELQLRACGVDDVRCLRACTYSNPDVLWSYRRDGAGSGRNVSAIWLKG